MGTSQKHFWLHHIHPALKFSITLVAGILIFLILPSRVDLLGKLMISWDAFSLSSVIIYWLVFYKTTISQIQAKAKEEDSSNLIVFGIVLVATLASMLAVIVLITSKDESHKGLHIASAIGGMVFSWFLVHSLFAVRYAHMYYRDGECEGLEFPGNEKPDFRDFAYFAFVIGMTFQVSDVEISSKKIRRMSLMHSLISFSYNTVIVALTINVIAGLK